MWQSSIWHLVAMIVVGCAPQIFDETGYFLLWLSWNGTASEMAPAVVGSTKSEVMAALEVASFGGHTNVIFLLFALDGVTVSDIVGGSNRTSLRLHQWAT